MHPDAAYLARQHITSGSTEQQQSASAAAPWGPGLCHNDAATANEIWNPLSSVFLLSLAKANVTHMTDSHAQTISSDTKTAPCIAWLHNAWEVCYYFLTETEEMETGSVCRPGNAFPLEIPNIRETNILRYISYSFTFAWLCPNAAKTHSLCNANQFLQRQDKTHTHTDDKTTAPSLWASANTNMKDSQWKTRSISNLAWSVYANHPWT